MSFSSNTKGLVQACSCSTGSGSASLIQSSQSTRLAQTRTQHPEIATRKGANLRGVFAKWCKLEMTKCLLTGAIAWQRSHLPAYSAFSLPLSFGECTKRLWCNFRVRSSRVSAQDSKCCSPSLDWPEESIPDWQIIALTMKWLRKQCLKILQ